MWVFCGIGYCASSMLRLTPLPHGTSAKCKKKATPMSGFLFALCARDSGGGRDSTCLSQTPKALCVFVNLHSHDTHQQRSFAKLHNLLLYLAIYHLGLLFIQSSFYCDGKQIIFRWLNTIVYRGRMITIHTIAWQ